MERLTEKNNGNTPYNQTEYPYLAGADINDITNKLGELEDIEQELGIPLEVLFKALKEGVWTNEYEKRDGRKIWLRNYDGKLILEVSNRFCFDVYYPKDYEVTWALTKEELEKWQEPRKPKPPR